MNKMKLALLVVLCLITAACSAKQVQDPDTVAASTEWRIKSLEESFLNFREEQRNQGDVTRMAGESAEKRITALELEVAALKAAAMAPAPMEEDTPDDMKGIGDDLKAEPGAGGWVDGQKVDDQSMAQSGEDKPWAEVPGEEGKPEPKPEPKVAKKSTKSTGQSMYDAALAKYYAEKYGEARAAFDGFVAKYPKSALVPNALYWKGETFYSEKDYAQSILAFKEVTGKYPKHSKAAAALLKIGMSYDKVGDKDNAIFYLRALVEDFPKSGPAKLARKELKRLGG